MSALVDQRVRGTPVATIGSNIRVTKDCRITVALGGVVSRITGTESGWHCKDHGVMFPRKQLAAPRLCPDAALRRALSKEAMEDGHRLVLDSPW